MRKFGLCLFYGLCVFTIAFSLFWMALPRLPLPEAPADETPPISGSVSSLVQAAAPTAAGYYLCDTGGRVAVYACNADGTPGALQQLTGIYVNLLPENDVLRIRRGIRVHSLPELQALLEDLGITGLVIDDEGDFRDFLEHNRAYWDYVDDALMQEKKGLCRITFYLEDSPDGYNTLSRVRMALSRVKQEHPEYGSLLLTMENMEDADWENNWKQFYKPMEIGDRLIVIPEWESAGVPEGRVALRLNPGLTFGTGSHATTRLCLTALEKHVRGGETVLDLGCGSGILSIAALLLGADRAVACDIDEKCMDVAYENAALNGVGRDRYTVRWGDVVTDRALRRELGGPYDVVVANIVADVIKALASTVRPLVREGGIFLCSGIIDTRGDEVAAALEAAGLAVTGRREKNGWIALEARLG